MSDPDLKINSLSRFSKKSPRLVLEASDNCEVPAGCGGVVLRWRRPEEPVPLKVRSFTGNWRRERIALDGADIGSQASVSCGRHALTLVLRDGDPEYACVLLAAKLDEDYVRVLKLRGDTALLSLPDGSWRYRREAPEGNSWQQPDFDDSDWPALVEKPFGPLPKNYGGTIDYWTRDITTLGARGLGVQTDTSRSLARRLGARVKARAPLPAVYIRKTFQVLQSEGKEVSDANVF